MITNSQILAEALEDAKNPEFRNEAVENIIAVLTQNAERDLKENLFDVICDLDKAWHIADVILNDYFGMAEPTKEVMASIANRYEHISMFLSLIIGLLHDSIESFKKYDLY